MSAPAVNPEQSPLLPEMPAATTLETVAEPSVPTPALTTPLSTQNQNGDAIPALWQYVNLPFWLVALLAGLLAAIFLALFVILVMVLKIKRW